MYSYSKELYRRAIKIQNIIFTAYAEELNGQNASKRDLYLQNAVCCLISARMHNPNDHVALITNIEIPEHYKKILTNRGIEVWVESFDCFRMPVNSQWTLAFYKLCALKHVVDRNVYDKALLLDTDVMTLGCYQELWEEANAYLLLHQVVHNYNNANEKIMRHELKSILGEEDCIHWGGEFACGKTDVFKLVLDVALERFRQMLDTKIYTTRGDEFIWTAALKDFQVKSSVAYIDRCWTARDYYFVSTHMYHSGLVALHLPNEKKRGILRFYKKIERNCYPSNERLLKMMRMPKKTCSITMYSLLDFLERIKRKLLCF